MSKAIYPGSFDPVTYGHIDIIKRAAKVFDEVVIGVLNNSAKTPLFSLEDRVACIQEVIQGMGHVSVTSFSGLLVDFAREEQADVNIRGLRAVTDFEYELQIAQINSELCPELDTMFFTTSTKYAYVSSTIVREVAAYHGDISKLVPPFVEEKLKSVYNKTE